MRQSAMLRETLSRTVAALRADAGLYLLVLVYTLAGLSFLHAAGAADRAAYAIYVGRWLMLFAFFLPAIAILADVALVIHRFDRRRPLAFGRAFSPVRIAALVSGMALLQVMMLFQGTFTSVKNALVVWQGGFPHDRVQADIDRWLHFGVDPWRWLQPVLGYDWVRLGVEWNYNVLWFVLCFGALFFVVTSPKASAIRTRYVVAFMLAWIVVGNLIAGPFMSAGPAFYGLVTGDEARFAEQLAFLARGAGQPNSAAAYQEYLWSLHAAGQTGFGSGISAFPSMHVALAMLNALFLADHSRRLGLAAYAYVAVIVVSSVYLAWHYAIDGYVAIAVVAAIHFALKRLMPDGMGERASAPATAAPAFIPAAE
ncbi:MAG: phosphatase PAP2 family protein [Rhizobiaceae bacterium]